MKTLRLLGSQIALGRRCTSTLESLPCGLAFPGPRGQPAGRTARPLVRWRPPGHFPSRALPRRFSAAAAPLADDFAAHRGSVERLLSKIGELRDWDALERERASLSRELADPDIWQTAPDRASEIGRRSAEIASLLDARKEMASRLADLVELWQLARADGDAGTLREVFYELQDLDASAESYYHGLLLPEPEHKLACIVELSAGQGGVGAAQFVFMLYQMYDRWARARGWSAVLMDESGLGASMSGEMAAKRMVLRVDGEGAYGWLRGENGLHRFIRYTPNEREQRRMTYFAAVKVYPAEAEDDPSEELLDIPASDLRVETMRASGAGGQHVNTTDSAVRITHLPTGTTAQCQLDRSQHRNRAMAMQWLRAKLLDAELERRENAKRAERKAAPVISFGSQLLRTYTLNPTELLKDYRTGYESRDVRGALEGDIDELLESHLLYSFRMSVGEPEQS